MQNLLKNEIYNIISGKGQVSHGTTIQAVSRYLSDGSTTSISTENTKQVRQQETTKLEGYITERDLWISDIDFSQFVSEGAEQRAYLKAPDHVIKLNDAIYYSTWKDYFHNLLLHNFFFPDTAYELLGFTKENDQIYAVVKQAFVVKTQQTDLVQVKTFLEANGFINNRNQDYISPQFVLIFYTMKTY
jgi:hypothetical protein